jgi:hypothetical protein
MELQFIVTSSGVKGGKAESGLSPVVHIEKVNEKDNYYFIDSKTFPKKVPEILPLGKIVTFGVTDTPQAEAGSKLNIKQA